MLLIYIAVLAHELQREKAVAPATASFLGLTHVPSATRYGWFLVPRVLRLMGGGLFFSVDDVREKAANEDVPNPTQPLSLAPPASPLASPIDDVRRWAGPLHLFALPWPLTSPPPATVWLPPPFSCSCAEHSGADRPV